jgi:hypothetical protein
MVPGVAAIGEFNKKRAFHPEVTVAIPTFSLQGAC